MLSIPSKPLYTHHFPTMHFNLHSSQHSHTASDHSLTYTTIGFTTSYTTTHYPTLPYSSIQYHTINFTAYLMSSYPVLHLSLKNLTPTPSFPALSYILQLYLTHSIHHTHIYPTMSFNPQALLHSHTSSDHSLTYTTIRFTTLYTTTHHPTLPYSSIQYPTIHFTAYLMPPYPALHLSFTILELH